MVPFFFKIQLFKSKSLNFKRAPARNFYLRRGFWFRHTTSSAGGFSRKLSRGRMLFLTQDRNAPQIRQKSRHLGSL